MKVILLLGAGATVADVESRPRKERPPLDKGFFSVARATNPSLVAQVAKYMQKTYASDIRHGQEDSLEGVMSRIYTDMFNPALEQQATDAFKALLKLFVRRLAMTTNNIEPTNRRILYRIITSYLDRGLSPSDLTIVTFNHDLQVEKSLHVMSKAKRRQSISQQLFNFPGCYCLKKSKTTSPSKKNRGRPVFKASSRVDDCIRILKLHGSLNWFSTHPTNNPSPTEMFDPGRTLRITRRRLIRHEMTFQSERYAVPVVVPPVTHKSAVLHDDVKQIWGIAETALREADELIIFGYSCPPFDFESANLLQRSQSANSTRRISVIDPNGDIAARYIDLLDPKSLAYFNSGQSFLTAKRD